MEEKSIDAMQTDEKEEVKMAVLSKPQKRLFTVNSQKYQDFKKVKITKERWNEIIRSSQNLKPSNLKNV